MQETSDIELLQQYVHRNSDEAFAALVTRHVNMVYSAALRKTGSPSAAEEVTQVVFIILAKKAGGLREKTIISGWLYQTTRLTAINFLRSEIRRVRREQEAYMQSLGNETESEAWPQIMPLLEDAMGQLGEKDRNAIALRFFEGKSFQEIGIAFGASENAAEKRVAYALEKLRRYFSKHGVTSTTATLAGAISANSVQAAPAVLAKSITAVAITKGAAASGSTLTLVKGALKIMAWTKAKTVLIVSVGLLLTAGTGAVLAPKVRQIYIERHPAEISVTNASSVTVGNVIVCGEHFSASIGTMIPTMSVNSTLTSFGLYSETNVWLYFEANGKEFDSRGKQPLRKRAKYFEVSSRHPLTLTIGADLSVTSPSGINSAAY
jgi:RNA polymerase sigma factor (sigma-70 family)